MKTISADVLPGLPAEVLDLIQQGVYSLFEIRDSTAAYLLVTSRSEFYLLDGLGGVAVDPSVRSIEDAVIVEAVAISMSDSDSRRSGLTRMNFARA